MGNLCKQEDFREETEQLREALAASLQEAEAREGDKGQQGAWDTAKLREQAQDSICLKQVSLQGLLLLLRAKTSRDKVC